MPGLLKPVQYGAPSTSYQDDESLCSSRQGLIRSQRSSTVSSTTPEERTALRNDDTYQESQCATVRLSIKRLLLFSLVFITLLVLSSIFTAIITHTLSSGTCTSISCVSAAETLRRKSAAAAAKSNNTSPVSPCEDFYEYACAGWEENSIIRSLREWNVAFETSYHSYDKITQLFNRLLQDPQTENLTTYQSGAVVTYASCMKESIEGALESLQMAYKEINGWLTTSVDERPIEEVLVGAYRTNALAMFYISAMIDTTDVRSRTVLTIEEAVPYSINPVLYATSESFDVADLISGQLKPHLNFWLHDVLFAAGLEVAKELGMETDTEMKLALARAILFDYKITRCSSQLAKKSQAPPEQWRTTLGELELYDRSFDFRFFLGTFLGQDIAADTEIVVAPGRDYFQRMMRVLGEYSTPEGQQIVRDYIKFKQFFMLSIYSGKLKYSRNLTGLGALRLMYTGIDDDRSLQCVNRVGMINPLGFVSLLEKYWGTKLQENMAKARVIGEDIRREYIDALRKSDVVDEVDRAALIDKAERIRIRVAVPEASRDRELLEAEAKMFVNETNLPWALYFCTVQGNRHWQRMSRFGTRINPDEWPTDTNTFNTNVHYNYESNSILFPILWSMGQFIDAELPSLFSFAGFGSIIGHEMTHAFDYKGRQFGPTGVDGNLTTGRTTERFEAKQKCFQEQYKALGETKDTDDVLSENLADHMALALSYKSWKEQKELGNKRLPGIELTEDQAFFTAYAQNWCTRAKSSSGTHSPGKMRVLGPLQNSRDFSEAFSCPAGSPMNPDKKCTLW